MAKAKVPKFRSLKEEQEFWQTHDSFEVLGEEGWEVVKEGATQVRSVYLIRVGKHGAWMYVPKAFLKLIGAKEGSKIRAQVEGNRLILEIASEKQYRL